MTKTVTITKQNVKSDKSSHMVHYDYVLADELNNRRGGTGSFAISNIDAIPHQIRVDLERKLGYVGFELIGYAQVPRPKLSVARP